MKVKRRTNCKSTNRTGHAQDTSGIIDGKWPTHRQIPCSDTVRDTTLAGLTGDMRNGSIRMRSRTSLHRTLAAQRKDRNPSLRNEVRNVEKSPEAIFPQGTTLAQPSGLLGKRCNIAISNFFLQDNIELFYYRLWNRRCKNTTNTPMVH